MQGFLDISRFTEKLRPQTLFEEFQGKSLNLYGEQFVRHSFIVMISCTAYCNKIYVLLYKHMSPDTPGFILMD